MTKLKAAGIVLLSVIILASYFIYPHISHGLMPTLHRQRLPHFLKQN
jgi:hypothetical protein